MGRIMDFELRRLFRCKVIGCTVGAFVLYGIAALVFSADAVDRSRVPLGSAALYIEGMLCSQLSVFTIGVLSVHCFASLMQNGEHIFLEQMGVPLKRVVLARLVLLSATCALSILVLLAVTALCLSVEPAILLPVASISIVSVCGIILLGCLIGSLAKNSFVGAFSLFAIAICSSFINMVTSGLFLQFDSNSLTARALAALTGWGSSPIRVLEFDLGGAVIPLTLAVGLAWWLLLAALVWVALRRPRSLD